jgi:hypothetical protein
MLELGSALSSEEHSPTELVNFAQQNAPSEDEAARVVRKHWPNSGINSPLMTDLPTPHHFNTVVEVMRPEKKSPTSWSSTRIRAYITKPFRSSLMRASITLRASNSPEPKRLLPLLLGTGAAAVRCFPEEHQRLEERKWRHEHQCKVQTPFALGVAANISADHMPEHSLLTGGFAREERLQRITSLGMAKSHRRAARGAIRSVIELADYFGGKLDDWRSSYVSLVRFSNLETSSSRRSVL